MRKNLAVLDVFDHVGVAVSDLDASRPFYELALAQLDYGEPYRGDWFYEWEDLAIGQADGDRPATRNLHLALVASSREAVDAWWRAMTAPVIQDDGEPGPRPQYSPTYYGGFVRDPDGNSVEAVYHGEPRTGENRLDHLWIRVRDLDRVAALLRDGRADGRATYPGRRRAALPRHGRDRSFALVQDEPRTENLHLAFPAPDRATVDAFHRAALEAGFRDNGAPGERPEYHTGYYGAFVLDPDGNNIEAVFHDRSAA